MCRLFVLSLLAAALAATDEAEILAAARAVDIAYQNRVASLVERLEAPTARERVAALRALAELRDPELLPRLMAWLQDPRRAPEELADGLIAVARTRSTIPAALFRSFTTHADLGVRQAASEALHIIGVMRAGDWMLQAREEDTALRRNAIASLAQLGHGDAAPLLLAGLRHRDRLVRRAACIGLGKLGDPAHGEALIEMLCDPDPGVRAHAAEALARLDHRPAIPHLLMALEANIAGARIAAALRQLTGEDFGFDPAAPLAARQEAIERGFAWLAAQRKP